MSPVFSGIEKHEMQHYKNQGKVCRPLDPDSAIFKYFDGKIIGGDITDEEGK